MVVLEVYCKQAGAETQRTNDSRNCRKQVVTLFDRIVSAMDLTPTTQPPIAHTLPRLMHGSGIVPRRDDSADSCVRLSVCS